MSEPRPAATVMIARDSTAGIEVLLLRRSSRSAFMPDVFVFPGGAVDAADASPTAQAQIRGATAPLEPEFVYAAARETFEEAGLLFCTDAVDACTLSVAREQLSARTLTFAQVLTRFSTAVDAAALRYFSRWITPPGETRRFDARFFIARAPAGQIALADAVETHDGRWLQPRDALAGHAAGDVALIFPTIKHLERLAAFDSVAELLDFAARKAIHPVMPELGEHRQFVVPSNVEGVW